MGFPLAEVLRIGALGLGAAVAGPFGVAGAAALTGVANAMDKEDDPETPEGIRKMKQKRREGWVDFATKLEKDKQQKLKKYPEAARGEIGKVVSAQCGADLRAVIKAEIFETENRVPDDQEVNLYAEAVSAKAREKL
jgi:uncharacterized protein YpuA (DUF1002 family)